MPNPRDILPLPPWEGPPIPKWLTIGNPSKVSRLTEKSGGRAQRIVMETVAVLSQRYNVPEPKIVFRPMEYTEARFRPPRTLNIEETFAKIVDTAGLESWDRFLKVVVAHEFKHYLQYRELGRPLTSLSEKEYQECEDDAWEFSFVFAGLPITLQAYHEFQKMRTLASEISVLHIVDGMPLEEAIPLATKTIEEMMRR